MVSSFADIKDAIVNFFVRVKDTIVSWLVSLHIDTYKALQLVGVFGVGFLTAFFFRRYFRELFLVLFTLFIAFFVLQYLGFVNINWLSIRSSLHVQPTDTLEAVFNALFTWLKERIIFVISFLIGFFIGTRVG